MIMNQYFITPRTTAAPTTIINNNHINFYNSPMVPPQGPANQIAKINLSSNYISEPLNTSNTDTPVSYRKSVITNARKRQLNSSNKNTPGMITC
jgi:hypothetical protein